MDLEEARGWVANMLDRVEQDQTTGKYRLGVISGNEMRALKMILEGHSTAAPTLTPVVAPPAVQPVEPIAPQLARPTADVALNTAALQLSGSANPEVTVCLDFGTAMSKAFAMVDETAPIELALGKRAGSPNGGYPVDSSLFISDDGVLYFGHQAVDRGRAAAASGRKRYDSPKARLSMGEQVDINKVPVEKEINPVIGLPVTEGELITLYLAYLTDLASSELEAQGYSRYCARRFARPCWPDARNKWAEPLLREMLAQAQVLADTLHDHWNGGIPLATAKLAVDKVRALTKLPMYLLDKDIPEPVAAAASLMVRRDEAQRELFLVIDVGAGTTDFGLFMLQHNPEKDVCLVRIVPGTIDFLEQAGNRVDDLLKHFVLKQEGIDGFGPEGRHDLAYMQSDIRLNKERLFRDQRVEIPLANGSRATVLLEDFLENDRVKKFGEQLQRKAEEVLSAAGDGYLDLMRDGHVRVVLTGGGADLPMVQALATGPILVKKGDVTRNILRKAAAKTPVWIHESYPQFEPQYSQLAVAIGGANPDLPDIGPSFEDFKGLTHATYTA
jgi:molecular chaperone HscA